MLKNFLRRKPPRVPSAHAAATVHVETHALGLVFYGLTAFVYEEGLTQYDQIVKNKCDLFYNRLLYWQDHAGKLDIPWAAFLLKDDVPNKEKLLREKKQAKANCTEPY